jgi:hypothetical protein
LAVDASGDHFEAEFDSKLESNGDQNNEDEQEEQVQGNGDALSADSSDGDKQNEKSSYIVNMHGLPYTITFEEIADFLEGNLNM